MIEGDKYTQEDIKKEIFYLRQKDIQSIKPANTIIFTTNENEEQQQQN